MVTFNTSKSFIRNKSKRYLGIEIEIAYMERGKKSILDDTAGKWYGRVGRDGSIRNKYPPEGSSGSSLSLVEYELRTAPTNGDLFIKQMLEYGAALNATKSAANKSCGLHVHVDARDLTNTDLDKVLMLWSKIERNMFSLVSKDRIDGDWCIPWEFKSNLTKIEEELDYWDNNGSCNCIDCRRYNPPTPKKESKDKRILVKLKSGTYDLERYRSLNLCALKKFGTLENRMHHGTTNVDNIINWALINANIVDYAKSHSMAHIYKLPRHFDTLLSVISNDNVRQWTIARKNDWKNRPVTTLYNDQIDDRNWEY